MYKCLSCGHLFEEGEQVVWHEKHGLDTPPYEKWSGCPICKSEYEEVARCEICGDWHLEKELTFGVCEECIDDKRYDFNLCYKISEDQTETIEINSLLASLFEPREIEAILKDYIKNNCPNIDCQNFIESDKTWFVESLLEEVNKK